VGGALDAAFLEDGDLGPRAVSSAPADDSAGVAHAAAGRARWAPAMKPATGFLQLALTQRAASTSALPPISPIMMMPHVSGVVG